MFLRKPFTKKRHLAGCTRNRSSKLPLSIQTLHGGDFSQFIRADCSDYIAARPNLDSSSSLCPTVSDVINFPGRYILNNYNCSVWLAVLDRMNKREMLSRSDYKMAVRMIPGYSEDLRFLWSDQIEKARSGVLEGSNNYILAKSTASPAVNDEKKYEVGDLSFLPPAMWSEAVMQLLSKAPDSRKKDPFAEMPLWHEVFFKLSSNPALNTDGLHLQEGHKYLMKIIESFYTEMVKKQKETTLPRRRANEKKIITRLPPIIMRRWRKLYRNQSCLKLYSQLFLRCVAGEEEILSNMFDNGAKSTGLSKELFRRAYSTVLLNDTELWLFFLTIPGRRDFGETWEKQWELTLHFTKLSVSYLLLSELNDDGELGTGFLKKFTETVKMCMNVCVWIKNDNKEGIRCGECILTIMSAYFDTMGAQTKDAGQGKVDEKVSTWNLLTILRSTILGTMWEKTQKVHYGSLIGYFDVCTVAALLDCLRPVRGTRGEGSLMNTKRRLHLLLHPKKGNVSEMFSTLQTDVCGSRVVSLYALITIGSDLFAKVENLIQNNPEAMTSIIRFRTLLEEWTNTMGSTFRLNYNQLVPLWYFKAHKDVMSNCKLQEVSFFLNQGSRENSKIDTWLCGCGCENVYYNSSLSCVACVTQDTASFSWMCNTCGWKNVSGVEVEYCLGCGAHPFKIIKGRSSLTTSSEEPSGCSHAVTASLEGDQLNACVDSGCLLGPQSSRSNTKDANKDAVLDESRCYFCSSCKEYSLAPHATDSTCSVSISEQKRSLNFARGYFTWRCGCGKFNSPLHKYCWNCSWNEQSAHCLCPNCKQAIRPTEEVCSRCEGPHPIVVSGNINGRIVECPGCSRYIPADGSRCPHCQSRTSYLVGPFVETFADELHICHRCAEPNLMRDRNSGALLNAKDHDVHLCNKCNARRPAANLYEDKKVWGCQQCGEANNMGCACKTCLALAPSIPYTEVSVWKCEYCHSVVPSWEGCCTTPGCGFLQPRVGSVTSRYSYSPWECLECGELNLSRELICRGCAAKCQELSVQSPSTVSGSMRAAVEVTERADAEPLHTTETFQSNFSYRALQPTTTRAADSGVSSRGIQARNRLDSIESLLLNASAYKDESKLLTSVNSISESNSRDFFSTKNKFVFNSK